jgi:hypothetical protein
MHKGGRWRIASASAQFKTIFEGGPESAGLKPNHREQVVLG